MAFKSKLLVLVALACGGGIAWPAVAQAVYKCGSGGSVRYSDRPCPGRIVDTADAPVPRSNARPGDVQRRKENRILAQAMRRRSGESAAQFEVRRRRASLLAADREECARLDTRMPVEAASLANPDPEEVSNAATALQQSRRRFRDLRC